MINFAGSVYYTEALFRLELICFELQDYEGALEYYDTLIGTDPAFEFIDLANIAAGLSTYNQGNFAGSRLLYNNILPSSDYFTLSEYLKAVSFVEEDNLDAAISVLQSIIDDSGVSSGNVDLSDRARIALAQILVDKKEE